MELQIGNPRRLDFRIHSHQGTRKLERQLHLKFKEYQAVGEWFEINDELQAMWDLAEPVNLRRLMGRPPVQKPRAVELVREQLKTGPKLASDLIAQGAEIGLSKKTIWRAGEELQVQKVQRGLSNTIEWSLPT